MKTSWIRSLAILPDELKKLHNKVINFMVVNLYETEERAVFIFLLITCDGWFSLKKKLRKPEYS